MEHPATPTDWVKSSYSGITGGGNCVEAAHIATATLVRNSKDRSGLAVSFTPTEWEAFIQGVKDGEFDR